MRGRTLRSPENVATAQRMRAEGKLLREIADHFGISQKTIHTWLSDPDGSRLRARKDSYAGLCVDCGAPTSGSEGRRDEPRCFPCASRKSGAERKVWTREKLIAAIREWAQTYGEPPALDDWNPCQARNYLNDAARADRWIAAAGHWPGFATVMREFGSWNAGLIAAGFTPRAAHGGAGNQLRRRDQRAKAAA